MGALEKLIDLVVSQNARDNRVDRPTLLRNPRWFMRNRQDRACTCNSSVEGFSLLSYLPRTNKSLLPHWPLRKWRRIRTFNSAGSSAVSTSWSTHHNRLNTIFIINIWYKYYTIKFFLCQLLSFCLCLWATHPDRGRMGVEPTTYVQNSLTTSRRKLRKILETIFRK